MRSSFLVPRSSFLLLASLLLAPGCGPDFDPVSLLKTLRVLELRATPAEARSGELVCVDPLLFVPDPARDSPAWLPPPTADPTRACDTAEVDGPVRYSWRACFLETSLRGMLGGGGNSPMGGGPAATAASCFDLPETMTLPELAEQLLAANADGGPPEAGAFPDISSVAIDLGHGPMAQVPVFVPPLRAPSSFCPQLEGVAAEEQGGRELWIAGLRFMVSLQARWTGPDGVEQVVIANKRLLVRPAADQIPEAQQGLPFRTPRLCATPGDAARACAMNLPPERPRLLTPNGEWTGEWSGEQELVVAPEQQVKLRPTPPPTELRQPYVAMKSCGEQFVSVELQQVGGEFERLENRYYAWFADGGDVARSTTVLGPEEEEPESAWEAPDEPSATGRYSLFLIVRDGRGGVAWSAFRLLVREE